MCGHTQSARLTPGQQSVSAGCWGLMETPSTGPLTGTGQQSRRAVSSVSGARQTLHCRYQLHQSGPNARRWLWTLHLLHAALDADRSVLSYQLFKLLRCLMRACSSAAAGRAPAQSAYRPSAAGVVPAASRKLHLCCAPGRSRVLPSSASRLLMLRLALRCIASVC